MDAVDRGALVTSPLAADTFAFQATPTLTAGGQFKRSVIWSRSKRVHRTESGWLVVAQMAAAAAIVVVVVVDRLGRTPMLLADVVVWLRVVVNDNFVVVIFPLVVSKLVVVLRLHLASISNFIVNILWRFAIAADFLLSEASVLTFVAQSDSRLHRAPE